MVTDSPAVRRLATQILALEAAELRCARDRPEVAARVSDKLRSSLSQFLGPVGYQSLLSRALALAKAQDPSLAGLRIAEDGSLRGFDALSSRPDLGSAGSKSTGAADEADRGPAAGLLVTHLLGLLATFIGEPLTLQLVKRAWPHVSDAPPSPSPEGRS
jgi:hypothetical protein